MEAGAVCGRLAAGIIGGLAAATGVHPCGLARSAAGSYEVGGLNRVAGAETVATLGLKGALGGCCWLVEAGGWLASGVEGPG